MNPFPTVRRSSTGGNKEKCIVMNCYEARMNFHPLGLVRNPYPTVLSPQSTVHSPQSTVHSPFLLTVHIVVLTPGGICRRHSNRSITSACLGTLNSQWFWSGGNLFAVWLAPLRRRDFFSIFKLDGGNWLLQANACILERRVSKMFTSQAEI